MSETFNKQLAVGGHKNSLGQAEVVVQEVLADNTRLAELYDCLFSDDAWVRMRAADALEKICRQQPEWLAPYIDQLFEDMGGSQQASLQWHFAQILTEVHLTPKQTSKALAWLAAILSTTERDWIATANAMTAVTFFAHKQLLPINEALQLLHTQEQHPSASVRKRAQKLRAELLK